MIKNLLIHTMPWIIIPLIAFYYSKTISSDLFPIVIIGFIAIIIIYYITQGAKKFLPFPIISLIVASVIGYYLIL